MQNLNNIINSKLGKDVSKKNNCPTVKYIVSACRIINDYLKNNSNTLSIGDKNEINNVLKLYYDKSRWFYNLTKKELDSFILSNSCDNNFTKNSEYIAGKLSKLTDPYHIELMITTCKRYNKVVDEIGDKKYIIVCGKKMNIDHVPNPFEFYDDFDTTWKNYSHFFNLRGDCDSPCFLNYIYFIFEDFVGLF